MDIKSFKELRCISCLTQLKNPEIGECFLTGNRMINQKESKDIGDEISWYEVTDVKNNTQISYAPRYGVMKKVTMEDLKK